MTRAASMREPLPTAAVMGLGPRVANVAIWFVVAAPALYQLALLAITITNRIGYPYDLEWMEGGMLQHAQRIHDGAGIYVPPSVDFIPFLYTPLYPSLLALFGGAAGITYTVGRAISVCSLIGLAIVGALQIASPRHQHPRPGPPWAGVQLALGMFCAYYPVTDGWYDIARADTLFLLLVTAAIAALPRWARTGRAGWPGHAKLAAGGALLALAFFTKQTGIIYVAYGGLMVLVLAWRRLPAFVGAAALVGLGGTWLLQETTNGWFWIYVSKIHRAHDFSWDRFWASFGNILWRCELPGVAKMPALGAPITMVVVLGLAAVVVTYRKTRVLPPQAQPLLVWSSAFAVSILVGAIGFGTEFAHFNAYLPAFLHGSLAAGAAVPAVYACMRILWGERARTELVATGAGVLVALPLAAACLFSAWSPSKFIPTDADAAAGAKLVARVRAIDGDVWLPSHPWYAHLAGKPHVSAHRMSIKDVTWRQSRQVVGLDDALAHHAFAAIVLDTRDLQLDLPALKLHYRPAQQLPPDERPHVYTGAGAAYAYGGLSTPETVWVPALPSKPPAGAKVAFDFEAASWTGGWGRSGTAWGNGPVAGSLPGQDLVLGATGARFATSMNGGDAAVGRMTSPAFKLDGKKLTLKLGGRVDGTTLRVELRVGDQTIAVVAVPQPGGDTLREVAIDLAAVAGQDGQLVLIDESKNGHLDVDDVWLWQ